MKPLQCNRSARVAGCTRAWVISNLVLCGLIWPLCAYAQGGYNLRWFTVNGGGDRSSGGNYTLHSSTGQPGTAALTGGAYRLAGGFWAGWSPAPISKSTQTYLPLILR
jgi:hypothetical protein